MMHGSAGNNSWTLPDFFYPRTPAVDSVEYFNRLHDANDKLETTCSNLTTSCSNLAASLSTATDKATSYSNLFHTNATTYSNLAASNSKEITKLNAQILRMTAANVPPSSLGQP
jgi:prophage DNA circulation protein